MELLGPPPRALVEAAPRANLFFDTSETRSQARQRPHDEVHCAQGVQCANKEVSAPNLSP